MAQANKGKRTAVLVRAPNDLLARLDAACVAAGRTRNDLILHSVEALLERPWGVEGSNGAEHLPYGGIEPTPAALTDIKPAKPEPVDPDTLHTLPAATELQRTPPVGSRKVRRQRDVKTGEVVSETVLVLVRYDGGAPVWEPAPAEEVG